MHLISSILWKFKRQGQDRDKTVHSFIFSFFLVNFYYSPPLSYPDGAYISLILPLYKNLLEKGEIKPKGKKPTQHKRQLNEENQNQGTVFKIQPILNTTCVNQIQEVNLIFRWQPLLFFFPYLFFGGGGEEKVE